TFAAANLGKTDPLVNPTDDPAVPNLTWTYHGATISPGLTATTLPGFSALSQFDLVTDSQLTSVVHRDYDGKQESTITRSSTAVPPGARAPGDTRAGAGRRAPPGRGPAPAGGPRPVGPPHPAGGLNPRSLKGKGARPGPRGCAPCLCVPPTASSRHRPPADTPS